MNDRFHCRKRLTELLRSEYDSAGRLMSVLIAEANALLTHNTEELENLVGEKNRLVTLFDELDSRVRELLSDYGFADGPSDIIACIAWCDDTGQVRRGWQALLDRISRCHQQNRANGLVLDSGRRQAQQALNILLGTEPAPDLYTAVGQTFNQTPGGRSLAKV